jgi:[ribosomal protein S5]-alanine N-acetyltransferase
MTSLIVTPRFELRELEPGDLDFVAAMLIDPDVMRFAPAPYTREEAAAWLERQQARYVERGYGLWLTRERQSGQPCGTIGLLDQVVDGRRELEVAYIVHRPYWGRGVATEAAAAVRDYAWRTQHPRRLLALVRPDNPAAAAVATKLGMRADSTTIQDGVTYRVFQLPAPGADSSAA